MPEQDGIWHYRRSETGDHGYDDLIDIIRSAFNTLAADDPTKAAALLGAIDPEHQITSLHFLLEAVASASPALPGALGT